MKASIFGMVLLLIASSPSGAFAEVPIDHPLDGANKVARNFSATGPHLFATLQGRYSPSNEFRLIKVDEFENVTVLPQLFPRSEISDQVSVQNRYRLFFGEDTIYSYDTLTNTHQLLMETKCFFVSSHTPCGDTDNSIRPSQDGNRVYFRGWSKEAGFQFWVTDGTVDGTHEVPGVSIVPHAILPSPEGVYIISHDENDSTRFNLWAFNETSGLISIVKNGVGVPRSQSHVAFSNGYTYWLGNFRWGRTFRTDKLFRSNGTLAETSISEKECGWEGLFTVGDYVGCNNSSDLDLKNKTVVSGNSIYRFWRTERWDGVRLQLRKFTPGRGSELILELLDTDGSNLDIFSINESVFVRRRLDVFQIKDSGGWDHKFSFREWPGDTMRQVPKIFDGDAYFFVGSTHDFGSISQVYRWNGIDSEPTMISGCYREDEDGDRICM